MTGEDLSKLFSVPTIERSMLHLYGPQGTLLILLYKLNVLGIRRVSQHYASALMGNTKPPPCSIPCAIVSLSREYLQFCPKQMGDEEYKQR